MLKANAYGHGAVMVAKQVDDIVDWYGVANCEEAIELRLNGIDKDILVSVFSISDSDNVVKYNLTPIVYNLEHLLRLNNLAILHKVNVNVHIKIDTGMNRIGIKGIEEFRKLYSYASKLSNIIVEGVCTHYYGSEKTLIDRQKALFDEFTYNLMDNLNNLIIHSASSNSIFLDKAYHYDMVRVGIAAYGYCDTFKGLQPAMNVITKIIAIKSVKKGETAGYSGIFKADRDTKLAIIRGGYYDGISRNMIGSNVIINGHNCRIVAVCMDITLIDISNYDVEVDDSVMIIGTMSLCKNTALEIANHCNTIPYETLTNIKGRIERVYYV